MASYPNGGTNGVVNRSTNGVVNGGTHRASTEGLDIVGEAERICRIATRCNTDGQKILTLVSRTDENLRSAVEEMIVNFIVSPISGSHTTYWEFVRRVFVAGTEHSRDEILRVVEIDSRLRSRVRNDVHLFDKVEYRTHVRAMGCENRRESFR